MRGVHLARLRVAAHRIALHCAVAAGLAAALGSCAGDSPAPAATAGQLALPWPPTAAPRRDASALQQVELAGNEALECGGSYVYLEDSLLLLASPKLTWGIYGLGGYFEGVTPQSVAFERGAETDPNCRLYIGLANFAKGCWEFPADPLSDFAQYPNSQDYVSFDGKIYIAAVQWTVYDLRIKKLTITNNTDAPPPPAGLAALSQLDGVQLSWEASPGASSYNVMFSTLPDNIGAYSIATQLPDLAYFDTGALVGRVGYYSVQANGPGGTSWPCDPVSAFVPEVDLPAPANLRTVSYNETSADLAWDWSGVSPFNFRVYVKEAPDFNLEEPIYLNQLLPGTARGLTIDVVPGHEYWFRVVAIKNLLRGRLSAAVQIESGEEWRWAPAETVGPGRALVRTCVANGALAAVYFDPVKFDVLLARRDSLGVWSVDPTGLNMQTDVLSDPDKYDGGFFRFLDVCFTGSQYFIVAQAIRSGALWYCLGTPEGGWKTGLIAGTRDENTTGLTDGWWCCCSATNGQLGVLHSYLWAVPELSQNADAYLQVSSDQGEHWSRTKLLENFAMGHHSLRGYQGEWYVAAVKQNPVEPPQPQEFWFMQSREDFAPHVLYSELGSHFGLYPDLERFGDHWLTCAFDNNDTGLYSLEGDGDNWTRQFVDGEPGYYVGANCRLAVHDAVASIIYDNGYVGWWKIARYENGGWVPYAAMLPSERMDSPDAQYLGDDLMVVYRDRSDGNIKCGWAVPPIQ